MVVPFEFRFLLRSERIWLALLEVTRLRSLVVVEVKTKKLDTYLSDGK